MITIRSYQEQDYQTLTDMFYQTIHTIGLEHYSAHQINAWAPYPINYSEWQQKMSKHKPWVAEINGEIAGFMSLDDSGLIHWAFTHQNHQRKGVAGALFEHIETTAIKKGINKLRAEASLFAQPFFAKKGFVTLTKNEVNIRGQLLTNFSVEKVL